MSDDVQEGSAGRRPWRSEHDVGSKAWHVEQHELVREMVESVKGVGLDGEPVDIAPNQFSVQPCKWNGAEIPIIMFGGGEVSRPLYFFRGYAFHPGTAPDKKAGLSEREPLDTPRSGRAFVVDTGWRAGQLPQAKSVIVNDIDPCTTDTIHGHGPAIVQLIERLAGAAAVVHLRQVGFSATNVLDTQGNRAIPIFTHPTMSWVTFRGFDEAALVSTLNRMTGELERGDVVNLSLGAVACPAQMAYDPVRDWVKSVTAAGVKVVVAAGNHETDAPSWPAAYATGLSAQGSHPPVKVIHSVHSVGSRTGQLGQTTKSSFSAHGDWVTDWQNGEHVAVRHPDPRYGPNMPNVTWSGTSFAAPIHTAELLPVAGRIGGAVLSKPDDVSVSVRVAALRAKLAPVLDGAKSRFSSRR